MDLVPRALHVNMAPFVDEYTKVSSMLFINASFRMTYLFYIGERRPTINQSFFLFIIKACGWNGVSIWSSVYVLCFSTIQRCMIFGSQNLAVLALAPFKNVKGQRDFVPKTNNRLCECPLLNFHWITNVMSATPIAFSTNLLKDKV